ncbi:zinc transporter ZntB [Psychrosphaera sp. B3R10]|uniref:Zinc transporter ZntB n=1 Tax=Psychrosphaera algicola TaxID=3023714 RepID=A0ABT5FCM7_9GAMM|nr:MULTISPECIES: zinc transporter ZntB [unclassified Psychrosphaera]MBU2882452.1 zinc transporter ZntB [Psychrosphaera sp. I2R16]MBU2990273.1 zinc transporter ZntB [Psychrosphaera sp. B3R10]MDC2889283.1 zinc transporter ZntB [Psychrosphaera sp. G1-22]MDO6721285.1 zinc transporter ZntB [Psychrosphaera sp. 1_MG-2023]
MSNSDFIYGFYFNAEGPADPIPSLNELDNNRPSWLHFDYTEETTQTYLREVSGLNPVVADALLCDETRPRATTLDDGLLISLRGVNLAPNSDPEDMVSIRLWVTKNRVISTRRRRLLSANDIAVSMENGTGPKSATDLVVQLTDLLISRMTNTIEDIEDKVSVIEESILTNNSYALRNEISDVRRQIISLRRYLSPQKEAMNQLISEKIAFFTASEKIQLRETTDHLTRLVEDLDSVRDRAAVTQEELSNGLAEQMNSRMYVLSIVAAIFLPLGFLTGLWGVNVGGIPGAESSTAFSVFVASLVAIISVQIWLFKKNKWF